MARVAQESALRRLRPECCLRPLRVRVGMTGHSPRPRHPDDRPSRVGTLAVCSAWFIAWTAFFALYAWSWTWVL